MIGGGPDAAIEHRAISGSPEQCHASGEHQILIVNPGLNPDRAAGFHTIGRRLNSPESIHADRVAFSPGHYQRSGFTGSPGRIDNHDRSAGFDDDSRRNDGSPRIGRGVHRRIALHLDGRNLRQLGAGCIQIEVIGDRQIGGLHSLGSLDVDAGRTAALKYVVPDDGPRNVRRIVAEEEQRHIVIPLDAVAGDGDHRFIPGPAALLESDGRFVLRFSGNGRTVIGRSHCR